MLYHVTQTEHKANITTVNKEAKFKLMRLCKRKMFQQTSLEKPNRRKQPRARSQKLVANLWEGVEGILD